MREGWENQTLEKVCERIFAGGDVPKNNFSKFKTDKYTIPIFANGEKNKGLYGYTDIPKVTDASITVSARGTIGYSEIRNEPFFPIVRLIVLVPNKDIIDLNFLKYVVSSMEFKKSGTSIPQLTVPMIKKYQANIPLLKEQKQIVTTLDKAFKQIDQAKVNLEKNLNNAKELFQSKLNEVFSQRGEGWEEKTLAELSTKITDGVHKKPNYTDSGVPFIKINNLTKGDSISFENVSYISEEDHLEYCKRTKPEKGDILITKDGTIGIVRVIDTDIEFSIFVSVALIKPIVKEHTPYLKYVLISPLIQDQIKPQGTALKHLYLRDLRKFVIPVPPLDEQEKIVHGLEVLEQNTKKLETHYQQKLNNLEELKKSILQKAFRGELDYV